MKFDQPIGSPAVGPMLVRIAIGSWFMLSGIDKINNLQEFMAHVDKLNFIPEKFENLYAIVIPYLEVLMGSLLVAGLWTTLAAGVATLVLASYVYPFGIFPTGTRVFNRDLLMLAGAASLLYTGAGAASLDGFKKSG